MKNRVFVIHGWGSSSSLDWMPWIKTQLPSLGYETIVPDMPNTEEPIIDSWLKKLTEIVGEVRPSDIFIGHSIGCQTILRYLEKLPDTKTVNQVILVAPWVELTNLENEQMWQIAEPWLKKPLNFTKIIHKSTSFTTIFSDNDNWVPLDNNLKFFKENLNPKIIILNDRGHFSADEGITEIPELLDLITEVREE